MSEKAIFSCPACGADYKVQHDLGDLYTIGFCMFCGEEVDDDDFDWDEWDEDDINEDF